MMKIDIKHNFAAVEAKVRGMQEDIGKRALASAMNKSIEQARTQMTREIAGEFNVTAGFVRERLRIRRASARRGLRLTVAAAFVLITFSVVYRTRPDTWAADNLYFGDRYFFIPRVLLAWPHWWSRPVFGEWNALWGCWKMIGALTSRLIESGPQPVAWMPLPPLPEVTR